MSVPARLAAFAALLTLLFAGAALAGSRLDVRPGGAPAGESAIDGMGDADGHGAAAQAVRGLAVSDRGLTLELARDAAPQGRRFALGFRIADRRGRTVRGFDLEHTKRMHVIVVRRDMAGFQHVHPVRGSDGTWSVPLTLRAPGSYRVFADFSVDGVAHTLAGDLAVDGDVRTQALPPHAASAETDGLRVRLEAGRMRAGQEADLGFSVTRNGTPVAVQDYLGAKGHLVALRQGDLAFLHVHPDEERLRFAATFPSAGRYRLFLQFRAEGRLHTVAFTQEVAR
jgi:hypothetical protein